VHSDWETLREGIHDSVEAGDRLLPWVHQDLGGHIGFPSPEQYIRWLQWGAFSPVMRIHCGPHDRCRYPWAFGPEALAIVKGYVELRYRLLPVFYAAAHRASLDGTPLLRKLAHEWPGHPEAATDDQFLLGDDLLVAPIGAAPNEPELSDTTLVLPGGFRMEVFDDWDMESKPLATRMMDAVRLNPQHNSARVMAWGRSHSIRWTGEFTPEADGDYKFFLTGNGRKALWIGENTAVIDTFDKGHNAATLRLKGGKAYPLKVHYHLDGHGLAECRLSMIRLKPTAELAPAARTIWLPPGEWENLWTGCIHEGPKKLEIVAALHQAPLFVRRGAILPLAPPMQYTGERPWDPLTLEVFPPSGNTTVQRELYEDDGESMGYARGEHATTPLTMTRQLDRLDLAIGPTEGRFPGCLDSRDWIVRIHLKTDEDVVDISENGNPVEMSTLEPDAQDQGETMPLLGPGSRPRAHAGKIVEIKLTKRDAARLTVELTRVSS
jgi:hypothetical protein